MYKYYLKSCIVLLSVTIAINAYGKENIGTQKHKKSPHKVAAGCDPATAQVDLEINNVRTTILNGGDLWWNLSDARYEIPKIEAGSGARSVHSLFAGAIWIGGLDEGGQLKIAAQTYRQSGDDFWPGPLDSDASIDEETCSDFDRIWKVNKSDIDKFKSTFNSNGNTIQESEVPSSILEWPAFGNPYAKGKLNADLTIDQSLAPFEDIDQDGEYNPLNGDYPVFEMTEIDTTTHIIPDQMLWWVYNDKGNIHSETQGLEIGLQIHATAFAFSTNDEVNDMTFYQYRIFNKATAPINNTYMAQWVDPDLGCYQNDYVGCDTSRSLGICYNGEAKDADCGSLGYGDNIPLVGIDFFKGPKECPEDTCKELGMSSFIYYENDFSVRGNPENAAHFYQYMDGFWKDGTPIVGQGNGYGPGSPTKYMYPSDPSGSGWSECSESNVPFDRRFLQSSGPFILQPGAVNEIIIGAVWVRPGQYPCPSFSKIQKADDKAQALFDNKFKLVDGPDAPTLIITELDKEIIIALENDIISNNYNESYSEIDPIIYPLVKTVISDTTKAIYNASYHFQGYQIYQLKDATISSSELSDPDKARLIFQVDIKDSITKLVNYYFDADIGMLGEDVPVLEVDGANEGIKHVFRVQTDEFATGNQDLVNFKTYYFMAIAYSHNVFEDPVSGEKQKMQYKGGRNNVKAYSAIPHSSKPENGGTIINASYGDGVEITRLSGQGNGGNFLKFKPATTNEILTNNRSFTPTYQANYGPVKIWVYNPLQVPNATFEISFFDTSQNAGNILSDSAFWELKNITTGEIVRADMPMLRLNQQLIPKWGLVVETEQVESPGYDFENGNGFLDATIEYANPSKQWLSGVVDIDGEDQLGRNWIRSGDYIDNYPNEPTPWDYSDLNTTIVVGFPPNSKDSVVLYDPEEFYENILDRTWAPYVFTSSTPYGPGRLSGQNYDKKGDRLYKLPSVNVVITSNRDLWTNCVVLEMGEDNLLNESKITKFRSRSKPSVDKDGNEVGQNSTGLGWFPGYAINMETGVRLNMMFSEDSWLVGERGNDMIWNPTSSYFSPTIEVLFGGKHYIYILSTKYSPHLLTAMRDSIDGPKKEYDQGILKTFEWVTMPLVDSDYDLVPPLSTSKVPVIPSDVTIRLRVSKPYAKYKVGSDSLPKYSFNTADLAAEINSLESAKSALDLIKIVPNPYYAYSSYEQSQLDNQVKITNLPSSCTVSIYSIDGILIKRFSRAVGNNLTGGNEIGKINLDTSIDWDLTNTANVPIASGIYIIHIKAEGIGERVIKWFGVMRPIDIDSF